MVELVNSLEIDFIFLLYWPHILKSDVIERLTIPILNCHLSYLPFNRGKNPNVWPIIDGSPAGVTIHKVDSGIDSGEILFQEKVEVDILDTGESLHEKLRAAMLNLLRSSYPLILDGRCEEKINDLSEGSINYSKDFNAAKEISLNASQKSIELINLLRAFTFPPYESAYFLFNGRKILVRIQLSEENIND